MDIDNIQNMLYEINVLSVFIRLLLSILIGGILGAERGYRNKTAGFLTYILVCMGSCLIMITNQYIVKLYPGTEPTRLAAQVVSGIGFLGAGTIIVTRKDEVRGLTTAAGLWVAAALGLSIGIGFYLGALIAGIFTLFIFLILKRVDLYIKHHAKSIEIYLEYEDGFSMRYLLDYAEKNNFELSEIERGKMKTLNKEYGTLLFELNLDKKINHQEILNDLYEVKGVKYIREIT